jgi:hypothetical protein
MVFGFIHDPGTLRILPGAGSYQSLHCMAVQNIKVAAVPEVLYGCVVA